MAKQQLSKTIRIDLIPAVPSEPLSGKRRRTLVTSERKPRAVVAPDKKTSERAVAYHEFLKSIYDAAIISDSEGRIVDVNERAVEFLLYSPGRFRQLSILDIFSGGDESLLETLSENMAGQRFTLIQAYCERRDGSLFPAEISAHRLDIGDTRWCFLMRDITVRRQAEEMLRTEHNAITNAGSGIAVTDIMSNLEYANPSTAQMWGYADGEEMMGEPVATLFSDTRAAEDMIATVMGAKRSDTAVMRARRKDGGEFDVQVSAVRNRNSDGELIGTVLSFVDVSDRQRAIAAERESERQRVMLESLGAVTHHMGQPATVLLGNLELLASHQEGLKGDDADLLESSFEAAESLSRILHRIMKVSEYKTTKYLEETGKADAGGAPESRILEI